MGTCGFSAHHTHLEESPPSPHVHKSSLTQNIILANKDKIIHDFYSLEGKDVLGHGVSGQVILGVHRATGRRYAIKRLNKDLVTKTQLEQLRTEINCMAQLDHPNILRLHEYFETDSDVYLVLELCTGGELIDRLHEQQGSHYDERIACSYVHTVLRAIAHCHAHGIVHRDLKLENLLFENKNPDAKLKIIDFGLSVYTPHGEAVRGCIGTPYYVAPEVLTSSFYNAKCDVWSIGVIAYMLVSGTPPFWGDKPQEILARVKMGIWKFDKRRFTKISAACKDFITKCLTANPKKRWSAQQALQHSWFRGLQDDNKPAGASSGTVSAIAAVTTSEDCVESPSAKASSAEIISSLRKYAKRSQLSKVMLDVVAHTLTTEQIGALRDAFESFDVSGTGEISLSDLKTVLIDNAHLKMKHDELEFIFKELDIDQKGQISYHEFLAAVMTRQSITEVNLKLAFEKLAGHKQLISPESIKVLLGTDSTYDITGMMEEAGLDRDAAIDYRQFKQICKHKSSTSSLSSLH